MAKQPPSPSSQSFADPMLIVAGAFMAFVLGAVLWSTFHTQIATAYSWLRIVELFIFRVLAEVISNPLGNWWDFFWYSDKSLIEFKHMTSSSLVFNLVLLVAVIIPAAVWIAKRSLKTHPLNHLHFAKGKDYDLHTFTDRMAEYYPHLKLFRKLNLTARSVNKGKYRMADTEKQFAIKHDLLDKVKGDEFKVNRDRAIEVFRGQMGRMWTGYGNLSRAEYAIIALLIPRIAATDTEMSQDEYKGALKTTEQLIESYWRSAANTFDEQKDSFVLDLELAKQSVMRYGKHPNVTRLLKQHAYVSTIIYSMLQEARRLGVLAACDMRWLRVVDRRLWLTVNNVGRIVAFAEMSGVYAHFLHEIKQKRAIERPMVDAAVKGLIEAVDSFKFDEKEVAEIERRLAAKNRSEKTLVDLRALSREQQTFVLGLETISYGGKTSLAGAVLMNERGDVEFEAHCKPQITLDDVAIAELNLSDERIAGFVQAPLSPSELCTQLVEQANKHAILVYGVDLLEMVPGLTRSAASIVDLAEQYELESKQKVTLAEAGEHIGHVTVNKPFPVLPTASELAQASRDLWVWLQKQQIKREKEQRAAEAANKG